MDRFSALKKAVSDRDCDALADAVNKLDQEFAAAPLLAAVLLEHWHRSHEDIVFELGLIGHPGTVEAIARAARTDFQSLIDWDTVEDFQRKCAYALARIGTDESREALEAMARSSHPHLREVGEECLPYWPMPYVRE